MRFHGQLITGDFRKHGRTEDVALNAAGWLNGLAEFMEGRRRFDRCVIVSYASSRAVGG